MSSIDPGARRLVWRKAWSSTGHGACVEVADAGRAVAVRDSKDPQGPVLAFPATEWQSFLAGAKRGDFDPLA